MDEIRASGRLRVVHVIDSLAGSGGAENRLVDVVVAMGDRFDQTVVRLFERDFLDERLREVGVPVVPWGSRPGGRGGPGRSSGTGWRRAAHLRPDVVHTSLFTGNRGPAAGARVGVPVVSTFNRTGDAELQRRLQPGVASWKGRVMQAVGRWAARRGDVHYRAVGEYARRTNCASVGLPRRPPRWFPGACRSRLRCPAPGRWRAPWPARRPGPGCGPGSGCPRTSPCSSTSPGWCPRRPTTCWSKRSRWWRPSCPARLAIAGADGLAGPEVRDAVERAGLGEAVSLLGFRADARPGGGRPRVRLQLDVRGPPGAVVEALMLGTPVAAFAISPVAELTADGEHAWLAEPGDAAALARAMLAAQGAPDRAERAAAAREWAEKRYSLRAVADQLGDLLESRAGRRAEGDLPAPPRAVVGERPGGGRCRCARAPRPGRSSCRSTPSWPGARPTGDGCRAATTRCRAARHRRHPRPVRPLRDRRHVGDRRAPVPRRLP